MNNLPFEVVLAQKRQDFHRCCQRVALTRGQQKKRTSRFYLQFRKQTLEDALRATRPHIDQVE